MAQLSPPSLFGLWVVLLFPIYFSVVPTAPRFFLRGTGGLSFGVVLLSSRPLWGDVAFRSSSFEWCFAPSLPPLPLLFGRCCFGWCCCPPSPFRCVPFLLAFWGGTGWPPPSDGGAAVLPPLVGNAASSSSFVWCCVLLSSQVVPPSPSIFLVK